MSAAAAPGHGTRRDVAAITPLALLLILLPVGRSAELGTLLAIIGVAWLAVTRGRVLVTSTGARLALLLFTAYFGAALISAPDAIRTARSWETVAGLLRFAALVLYAAAVLDRPARWRLLARLIAVVTALWTLDAWLQLATGFSVGGPAEAERITGVFGADDLKLGIVLAALAPFVLWAARERFGRAGLAVAFVFLLVPILVAGERQAWPCYALVAAAFAWRETCSAWRCAAWLGTAAVVAVLATAVTWSLSPRFEARITRSAQAFDGSAASVNQALSGRLDIWHTALEVTAAHPVNGVGVRDFRYAYPHFAPPDDHFVTDEHCGVGGGACHPHQWLLEVASETGLIGLALWLAGIAWAWRAWRRAAPAARAAAFPVTVALATVLFPVNTHLAFYSAWWGLFFWWLVALWCAAITGRTAGNSHGA